VCKNLRSFFIQIQLSLAQFCILEIHFARIKKEMVDEYIGSESSKKESGAMENANERPASLPERKKDESKPSFLQRLKNEGYLFHGSTNKNLNILEPRSTYDPDSAENTDKAVFATNNVTWSIIFGLYGGRKGWRTNNDNGKITAFIPESEKENLEKSKGIVYVLPRDTFKRSEGDQYKTYEEVEPYKKIEVDLNDYYDAGGKIVWTD